MRRFSITGGVLLLACGVALSARQAPPVRPVASHAPAGSAAVATQSPATLDEAQRTIAETCASCHSDRGKAGGISLQGYTVASAADHLDTTEKMIRKLRAGQMPPAGSRRPEEAVLDRLASALEAQADARVAEATPGRRTFQRLNRAEYTQSVRDLLDARHRCRRLPAARHQERQLRQHRRRAAALAHGDAGRISPPRRRSAAWRWATARATAREATYQVSRWTSQREHVEGRRSARAAACRSMHTFPADGEYRFRVSFYHETTGALYGNGRAALHTAEAPEQIEISIDGERVALLDVDRWMNSSDPDGVNLRTEPIAITAGPHRVVGGVHPPLRRAGAGPHHAARVVDRQHQHRRRLRLHHAAAPARSGHHRAVRGHRRVRDAEPRQGLRLPAGVRGAADALRPSHRDARWPRRPSAARRPSATSTR